MNILRNLRVDCSRFVGAGEVSHKPTKIACHTCYGKFTSSMYLNILP